MNTVKTSEHLLSETGSAGAVHRNYVKLTHSVDENTGKHTPLSVQFTETFSKAKNPDEHRVRFTLNFGDEDTADRLVSILNNYL